MRAIHAQHFRSVRTFRQHCKLGIQSICVQQIRPCSRQPKICRDSTSLETEHEEAWSERSRRVGTSSGGSQILSDREEIDAEVKAQQRLSQACMTTMCLKYCRDLSSNRFVRKLREVNIDTSFDFRRWRKHQRSTRHLNNWTFKGFWSSDNIRRLLFPDLAIIGTTSSLLCCYNMLFACPWEEIAVTWNCGFKIYWNDAMLSLPIECFTLTSMALTLLVTFKTQTAYARFIEARKLWGDVIHESRALSSRALVRIPSCRGSDTPVVLASRRQAVLLVKSFPLTLKYHLTEDGCNPHIKIYEHLDASELRAATTRALEAELRQIWDIEDAAECKFVERIIAVDVNNRPLHVLHELSHINASIFCHPLMGGLDDVAATEMDRSISNLHHALTNCEGILRTPIYTSYTRFTSRFIWSWCNALPLTLFPLVGPVGTVPVALVTSFFMFGIEDIGSRVEQPFDVLPLWQYCETVDQGCNQLLKHSEFLSKHRIVKDVDDEIDDDLGINDIRSFIDPL